MLFLSLYKLKEIKAQSASFALLLKSTLSVALLNKSPLYCIEMDLHFRSSCWDIFALIKVKTVEKHEALRQSVTDSLQAPWLSELYLQSTLDNSNPR